ncbi:hypothetical protein XELAEV_18002557mg [Xenopus laevis]|uniref:Uncharacterized protein n=1 Tax=Xenopus laevis TaxID=8355 RepID=A0A974GZ93_XENLA|nr:hypothetical protein XELAEV_18002557mg [Xenopus laevis]
MGRAAWQFLRCTYYDILLQLHCLYVMLNVHLNNPLKEHMGLLQEYVKIFKFECPTLHWRSVCSDNLSEWEISKFSCPLWMAVNKHRCLFCIGVQISCPALK